MSKRNKNVLATALVLIFAVGSLSIFYLNKQKVPNEIVKGTVSDVVDKPNVAEDGYYGITVQDGLGNNHMIDATGYLNVPISPDTFGEACVDVPQVKVGDSVEFNLPKTQGQSHAYNISYNICYKKNQHGYFFKQI